MGSKKYGGRRASAFIFDLDGTLIDSGRDIALGANFVRGHFKLPELPVETLVSYIGDGVRVLMGRALGYGDQPLDEETLSTALGVFADHYDRHCLDNTSLYPNALSILMRYRRFPLLLATNKPRNFTDRILEGLHIDGAFSRIVAADDATHLKPHPDHLRACLVDLDVDPAEVVVVGDSPNDIEAARAFGAVSVGLTCGLVAPGLVSSAGPDFLIDDIGRLAELFPSR